MNSSLSLSDGRLVPSFCRFLNFLQRAECVPERFAQMRQHFSCLTAALLWRSLSLLLTIVHWIDVKGLFTYHACRWHPVLCAFSIKLHWSNTYLLLVCRLMIWLLFKYSNWPVLFFFILRHHSKCGPGSSVGIVTDYGLDSPGIESRWGRFSAHPDRPWGPPSLHLQWLPALSWGIKCGRGVLLTATPF
jgi:hypothetical protein